MMILLEPFFQRLRPLESELRALGYFDNHLLEDGQPQLEGLVSALGDLVEVLFQLKTFLVNLEPPPSSG